MTDIFIPGHFVATSVEMTEGGQGQSELILTLVSAIYYLLADLTGVVMYNLIDNWTSQQNLHFIQVSVWKFE